MTVLLDRVRQFILAHDLLDPGDRVVAAVSGGSDSVALACLLHELHKRREVTLVGLAHFNHQLRATSDRDEQHAGRVAGLLGLPMLSDRADVNARAKMERQSLEVAGRRARYAFFERARAHFRASLVALGHTRDDQAETFLLRLVRGAGVRGLSAMHPRKGAMVRPLLTCRRSELQAFLAALPVAFMHDESNDDVAIPRNRVRAELIPLLEHRFNPSIVDVLADEAELARETWQWLHALTHGWVAAHVRGDGPVRRIDLASLAALPAAGRRLVFWTVLNDLAGSQAVGFGHVSSAMRVADPCGPAATDVPGVRVERLAGEVVLTGRDARIGTGGKPETPFRSVLSIPGEVRMPDGGWVVSAETIGSSESVQDVSDPSAVSGNGVVALVRHDRCHGSLAVRTRRPGDRFHPAGLAGRKKLQDFFVDRKVARRVRDTVPLVVDEHDRIIWVAGHRIDETFRVTNAAQPMLLLRLRQT
jgi:tRNA(Ile)-lysidine synthase